MEIVNLPDGVEIARFVPVAYYDKFMDCIRVHTHDRSVTEHRLNEFITVHECNHPGPFDPQYVGFTIKGIRHLLSESGMSLDRAYKLADVIDRLVRHQPGSMMAETLKVIFQQYKTNGDLEVDLKAA